MMGRVSGSDQSVRGMLELRFRQRQDARWTQDGRTVRMLNLIDEHTPECLMIRCERSWSSARVIAALADIMVMKGVPEHLRSDNGPEFVAEIYANGWLH